MCFFNVKIEISEATGIVTKDIIQTLLDMGMFKYLKSKYYIVNDKVSYLLIDSRGFRSFGCPLVHLDFLAMYFRWYQGEVFTNLMLLSRLLDNSVSTRKIKRILQFLITQSCLCTASHPAELTSWNSNVRGHFFISRLSLNSSQSLLAT